MDNCHDFVAEVLNEMEYGSCGFLPTSCSYRFGTISMAVWVFFLGRYAGVKGFIGHWLPVLVVVGIVMLFKYAGS